MNLNFVLFCLCVSLSSLGSPGTPPVLAFLVLGSKVCAAKPDRPPHQAAVLESS